MQHAGLIALELSLPTTTTPFLHNLFQLVLVPGGSNLLLTVAELLTMVDHDRLRTGQRALYQQASHALMLHNLQPQAQRRVQVL